MRKKDGPTDSGTGLSLMRVAPVSVATDSDKLAILASTQTEAQALVLKAWPEMVKVLIDLAMRGNVDAFRELRMAVVEPMRKIGDGPEIPEEIIGKAMAWLDEPREEGLPIG